MTWFDEGRLDDARALASADLVLRSLAESGARVRREAHDADAALQEAVVRAREQDRPRAVVAAGPDSRLLRAVLEPWCPVPFVAWPAAGLPGWAGGMDLVVVLAPSGTDSGPPRRRPRPSAGAARWSSRRLLTPWWPSTRPAAGRRCCRRAPATSWRRPW
ncbi:MAG: hypothetical protein R2731_11305 [Nocardioides sp.]